jgi:hypothetical protein
LRLLWKTLNDWQAYSVKDEFSAPPSSVFLFVFYFFIPYFSRFSGH